MISEWFVGIGTGVAQWFATLFPPVELPEWFVDPTGLIAQLAGFADGMGVWVPWTFVGIVISAIFLNWLTAAGIQLVRTVATHLPFIGGKGA